MFSFLAKPVNELVGVNPNAGQTDPPPRPGTGIPVLAMPQGKIQNILITCKVIPKSIAKHLVTVPVSWTGGTSEAA